jgi:PIN domain nuclease of toxin-antitoxin system
MPKPINIYEAKTRLSELVERASGGEALPNIHRDPFDRMLIAQATVEGLTLATADEALSRYAIPLFRALE